MTKKNHYQMSPKMENVWENRAGSKLPRVNKYKNQIKAEASSIDSEPSQAMYQWNEAMRVQKLKVWVKEEPPNLHTRKWNPY